MPSVNDPHHERVIEEAQALLREGGWMLADAGYEHVYSGDFKTALSKCDAVAAHLIRTRADRIALHVPSSRVIWYDAKTSIWKKGQDFPIEALPFLKACCDAKTFGIDYLFCCRRQDGTDYGLVAGPEAAQLTKRVLVPTWRRADDVERWRAVLQPMMDSLGCTASVGPGKCGRGGGDAFAAIAIDTVPMHTWQDAIRKLQEYIAAPSSRLQDRVKQ